ncbi:hypothetical protein [Alphabaculovirus altersperidaniae]|uniref:Ac19-like protein n=1 Tax=Spodoptera eridania nucleopolyhedrovirus TaxID=2315721 RepID=A0ABX6TVB2_9ABAC|nr:hypothetical protein QKS47_gp046 [Spodoptera eridania nucleopolyhedrovirus]QNV47867.1 hypothetical protein [Spodoptera eridania nucleopolyhedrovirus]
MMNFIKPKNPNQLLNAILNINNLVDTSKSDAQRMFYALCFSYVKSAIGNSATINAIVYAFDKIIQFEHTMFRRRRVLDFVLSYLVNNSDGDSIQCSVNTQCLDYLMTKYID